LSATISADLGGPPWNLHNEEKANVAEPTNGALLTVGFLFPTIGAYEHVAISMMLNYYWMKV